VVRFKSGILPFMVWVAGVILVAMSMIGMVGASNRPTSTYEHTALGVAYTPVEPFGIRVDTVHPDSPAAQAGLQSQDIIYTLDGMYIHAYNLDAVILESDVHTLGIERNGQNHTLTLTLR
jgi:S1-C subfamily serine protease